MCTEKCKKWFSLATSAIGVILGVSAFVVLFCIYKNYDAGLWAILSAVLAGVAFHLNYLHLKEKLDLWHSPETLDSIKGLGTMTLIGGLTGVIWYIFIALYKSIPILPVSNSAAIMAVWAFMMAKWGLVLILYGNKYIHIVATSHRSLIDQAVTSHRPLIDQAVTSHRPLIDQAVTSHRPLIDQAVTSHRPLIEA